MSNELKRLLLENLGRQCGRLQGLPGSKSLYVIGDEAARLYVRYSKTHDRGRTFYGLRDVDLRQLEGRKAFICFLTDDGSGPVFIPYADFEEVFRNSKPASDGQFKVQLVERSGSRELYVPRAGRFSVEGSMGYDFLKARIEASRAIQSHDLSHSQAQTLVAGVGNCKDYDVFVPDADVERLDWNLTRRFTLCQRVPTRFDAVRSILAEIDVVWFARGGTRIEGLFEVEHSTPVYSGLLRFNDVLLTAPDALRFTIVSNDSRRALFSRQVNRPTFQRSGLSEQVTFLEYADLWVWHERLAGGKAS